ncbi:MAG: NAD(P)/FAD-dependent oxidoreductase [Planctomycetota bacterium]
MPTDVQIALAPGPHEDPVRDELAVKRAVAKKLRVPVERVARVEPRKLSFDARPRERRWHLAARVWLAGEPVDAPAAPRPPHLAAPADDAPRVVVVGAGPAGMFCALDLASAGLRVVLLDRGGDVQQRRRPLARLNRGDGVDEESNYCFGEGGAGTYSDGKLYTRSGDKREVRAVLELLVAHGARADILYQWRPHIGSNKLPEVVKALRETLVAGGVLVRYLTRAVGIERDASGVVAVRVVSNDPERPGEERIACDAVVLATGHSAQDAVEMARRAGAVLEPKGFAMGVRGEHPQDWLDRRQYGGLRETCELPAAFYEVVEQVDEHGVYSFCMCPGGFVVPATTAANRVVVNGMSLSRRDSPFANSGLVVAIEPEDWCGERGERFGWRETLPEIGELPARPEDDPCFGRRVQEALERRAQVLGGGRLRAPAQRVDRFVERSGSSDVLATSYRPGVTAVDLRTLLPRGIAERLAQGLRGFDRALPGFVSEHGQLIGVESRTSSPVRVARDGSTLASPGCAGLFPCGEGAGFAGGIVSAAIDGRRVAAAVVATVAR